MNTPLLNELIVHFSEPASLSLHHARSMMEFLKPMLTFSFDNETLTMIVKEGELMNEKSPDELIFILQIVIYTEIFKEFDNIYKYIQGKTDSLNKLHSKLSKMDNNNNEKSQKTLTDKIKLANLEINELKNRTQIMKKTTDYFLSTISKNEQINELVDNIRIIKKCSN